jgi:hypothetical protein
LPDAAVLPVRIFMMFWLVVAGWCLNFIYKNGMLYVSFVLLRNEQQADKTR